MYIVSPSCLPIPTSRHNLLYFNELILCGPGEIRTHNDLNANQVLYQLELQAQYIIISGLTILDTRYIYQNFKIASSILL